VKFLNYRPRSESEVVTRLRKQKTEEHIIEEVLSRLRRSGLVDDQKFAQAWVENRAEFRPRSIYALRVELRKKGISDEAIEEVLDGLDEEELAYQAARKQVRKYRELEWEAFRKKLSGYLARRGFNYGIISSIVPKVWEEQILYNSKG
jgi:regulatory protein